MVEVGAGYVDMTTEKMLFLEDKPQFNHNGGGIAFGPDKATFTFHWATVATLTTPAWAVPPMETARTPQPSGQNLWEEVDIVSSGGNYRWNLREGTHCFDPKNPNQSPANCSDRGAASEMLNEPIIEYGHDLGTAIVGG